MKKVLFVCSANIDRSKTAEDLFSTTNPEIEFKSAGTNETICNLRGTNFISQELIDWADHIFAMENKHRDWIYNNLKTQNQKIVVLHIKDEYTYFDKELLSILEFKCSQFFK